MDVHPSSVRDFELPGNSWQIRRSQPDPEGAYPRKPGRGRPQAVGRLEFEQEIIQIDCVNGPATHQERALMNLYPQVKSTVGMLIVCVISGLLSGRLFTQGFQDTSSIREGALVGPGLVFGLLFSITIAGPYIWRREHMLFKPIGFVFLFTIASTIIVCKLFSARQGMVVKTTAFRRIIFQAAVCPPPHNLSALADSS